MSYARFGANDSDVYIFRSVGDSTWPAGWLECCGCRLALIDGGPYFYRAQRTSELLAHLREHERAGHTVPPHTYESLRRDEAENDAELAGAA